MIEQSPLKNPRLLAVRYPQLSKSSEVLQAVRRHEKRSGVVVENKPEARIQVYLDRFSEILARPEKLDRERGIQALKKILFDKFVVKIEDVPESYWQAQLQLERNRGKGGDWQGLDDAAIESIKQEHLKQAIEDQKGSLEEWIDYLTSESSRYLPDYLKYWVFAGMLRLDRFEKQANKKEGEGRFPERPSGRQRSVKMFPELNVRGLEFFAKAQVQKSQLQAITFRHDIPQEARDQFLVLLQKNDFSSVYSWLQEHVPPITKEELMIVDGVWVQYVAGEEKKLTEALQGKGSGWCIAGEGYATQYLKSGTVHIYFTNDLSGEAVNPRVAIVEEGMKVTQVRGIEWQENIDPIIKRSPIISEKLALLPGGSEIYPTEQDTQLLTLIDKKMSKGQPLTAEELLFLYEIQRPILYFGYEKDPRIEELRSKRDMFSDLEVISAHLNGEQATEKRQIIDDTLLINRLAKKTREQQQFTQDELRFLYMIDRKIKLLQFSSGEIRSLYLKIRESRNLKEDATVILDVLPEEIAWSREEITDTTKIYIGELFPGIFAQHKNFERIFTVFPDREVAKSKLVLGTKKPEELVQNLLLSNVGLYEGAKKMILSRAFQFQAQPRGTVQRFFRSIFGQTVTVVKLRINDLGITNPTLLETVFAKADELGLEPCNPEVGPHYVAQHADAHDWQLFVAMKSLFVSNLSNIFLICRGGAEQQKPALDSRVVAFDDYWSPTDKLLFQVKNK